MIPRYPTTVTSHDLSSACGPPSSEVPLERSGDLFSMGFGNEAWKLFDVTFCPACLSLMFFL